MATYNSANGNYQSGNKSLFEAQMLAVSNGHIVDANNRLPVDIGNTTINISGNVNVVSSNIVQVDSTPEQPVHVHVSEIGTSGILTTDYMPVGGNVTVNGSVSVVNGYPVTQNVAFSNQSVYLTTNVIAQVNNLPVTQNVSFSNQTIYINGGTSNTNVYNSNGLSVSNTAPLPVITMTENSLLNAPWELQVSRGKVPGVTQVNVFGYSNAVSNTAWSTLWENGTYVFPAAAATLNVYSTSASDAGATVFISGLDASYNIITETITLAGTSNVTTTNAFLRVNAFQMITPNTSQTTNIGTVVLRNAANVALMYPQVGRMQNSWYSIPAGHSLYVTDINIFSGETKTGATPTWFYYRVRNHNNTTNMTYDVLTTSFQNEYKVRRNNPVRYVEKSDIQWQFSASDAGPHTMGIILEGLLIADNAP